MPIIQWEENLSVKVESIDFQHKILIGLINDTYDALVSNKGRSTISKIFTGLIDYTKEHFSFEEGLFNESGYRDGLKHRIEHVNLTEQVVSFYRDYVNGKSVEPLKVLDFLVEWLQKHILVSDMKFGEFLATRDLNK